MPSGISEMRKNNIHHGYLKISIIGICTLVLSSSLLHIPSIGYAQVSGQWGVDFSSRVAPMARVNIFEQGWNTRSFAIVFETSRNCDPMFSMFRFDSAGSMGELRSINPVGPNMIYVTLDGQTQTWYGVIATYSNSTEYSMLVSRELWNSLLLGPNSIQYTTSQGTYEVPVGGLVSSLASALRRCVEILP